MNEGEFSDDEDDVLEDIPLDESASAFAILENEYKTVSNFIECSINI